MSGGQDPAGDVIGVGALDEDAAGPETVGVADTDDLVGTDDVAGDVEVLDDVTGNRVVGGQAVGVLEFMARQIVDEPDAVVIEPDERGPSRVDLRLHVAPDDMGKIIGRRGRVAQAIRTVVRAVGAREGVETTVDIVD